MASMCSDSPAIDDTSREIVNVLIRFMDNPPKSVDLTDSMFCSALNALHDIIFSTLNASKVQLILGDLASVDAMDQSPLIRIVRLVISRNEIAKKSQILLTRALSSIEASRRDAISEHIISTLIPNSSPHNLISDGSLSIQSSIFSALGLNSELLEREGGLRLSRLVLDITGSNSNLSIDAFTSHIEELLAILVNKVQLATEFSI